MLINIRSFDFNCTAQRGATYLGDEANITAYSRMVGWENETAFVRKLYVAHSLSSSSEGYEYSQHCVKSFPD